MVNVGLWHRSTVRFAHPRPLRKAILEEGATAISRFSTTTNAEFPGTFEGLEENWSFWTYKTNAAFLRNGKPLQIAEGRKTRYHPAKAQGQGQKRFTQYPFLHRGLNDRLS
ncbi:hypothetical protein AUK22_10880 [bacterium CG2_30_54_10]|nr:MAG: hypothetical protein AUK22_10880 [bacterium CG2_30_54_10]